MNVEVAICTWNRARLLRQTLESVFRLNVPSDCSLAVIVVDNNSTDGTEAVLREFAAQESNLVTLQERRQGHTISRNRIVRHAAGDLLLWTDDDVIVDPDWLMHYVQAARSQTGHSFWGGPIRPVFESARPDWIGENWQQLKGCFAAREFGSEAFELTRDRLPYGANFAIRTAVKKQYVFAENLGRRAKDALGEDELDLFRRLFDAGLQGAWVSRSAVDHVITPDRAAERYVIDYFIGQGRALVAAGKHWTNNMIQLRQQAIWQRILYRCKRNFSASPAWTAHMIRSALAKGQYLALREAED
jgi:glycosyltransferase involved in cell wall biosynthesis